MAKWLLYIIDLPSASGELLDSSLELSTSRISNVSLEEKGIARSEFSRHNKTKTKGNCNRSFGEEKCTYEGSKYTLQ